MVRRLTFVILILFISVAHPQYNFSAVDKLLKDSLSVISGIGGGCALIITKDGKTIYSKSYALPLRSYSEDKVVPIASASKWLSAGVIMSLIEENKLSLDDTLGHYFSYFEKEKQPITLRQLFSHTSGYGGDAAGDTVLSKKNISLDSCVKIISEVPLYFPPGKGFYYGGYGMQIAGRIAEIASGLNVESGAAWDTLFSRKIAAPLELKNTNYEAYGATQNPRIAGGVESSATEYMKYILMLLNNGNYEGRQILSNSSVELMLKDQTNNAPIIYSPYFQYEYLGINPFLRYGIGNWNEIVDSSGRVIESGSQGAFGFSPWIDKQRNTAGVLSVFSTLEKVMPTYVELRKIIRIILDAPTGIIKKPETMNNFVLEQNYPNPFNPVTSINYSLPVESRVNISVYNLLGQLVKTLVNKMHPAGNYEVKFNSGNFRSGVYFYTINAISADGAYSFSSTKKAVLIK